MPIGFCPACQRQFVIEDERSYQRTCPRCLHPMQVAAAREKPPQPPSTATGASPAGEPADPLWLAGEPLSATRLGRRALAAIAAAAQTREEARALRQRSRRLRGAAAAPPHEVHRPDPPAQKEQ